jgi:CBS domain-containing protein
MRKNELATKIMTPASKVKSVHVDQKLSEVRHILGDHQVHHVPVLSGDTLVGLISATDMLKMTFTAYGGDDRSFDAYLDHEFKIEDIMTRSLTTLNTHATIREVALLLSEGVFNSVPILDENEKFAGLVTTTDLARHVHDLYS